MYIVYVQLYMYMYFSSSFFRAHVQDNEYVHALKAVGSVLAPYDTDQLIPAYGFGARMPDGQVSHCFPLNFNDQRPDVYGVQVRAILVLNDSVQCACSLYMYSTCRPLFEV